MLADGGQVGAPAGDGPTAQVRHLEHRQFLHTLAVVGQDLSRALLGFPKVDQGDAVLAEEAGHVVAPVRRNQAVVGLVADIAELRHFRLARPRQVGHPDLSGIEQGKSKLVARNIGQSHHLGALATIAVRGGYVGEQFERVGIEDLHTPGLVVLRGDQASVLRDRAAD